MVAPPTSPRLAVGPAGLIRRNGITGCAYPAHGVWADDETGALHFATSPFPMQDFHTADRFDDHYLDSLDVRTGQRMPRRQRKPFRVPTWAVRLAGVALLVSLAVCCKILL